MEQDDMQQPIASPEKEEREAEKEDEIERPPRGRGAYERSRDTSRCSSIDRSDRATTQESTEGKQRGAAALQAAGGRPPPGPDVTAMPRQDSRCSIRAPTTTVRRFPHRSGASPGACHSHDCSAGANA